LSYNQLLKFDTEKEKKKKKEVQKREQEQKEQDEQEDEAEKRRSIYCWGPLRGSFEKTRVVRPN